MSRAWTTIDEVTKTGMAIELVRGIIDKAMPEGQDEAPEYDYGMRAPLYNLAHSGIENGLKALIRQVEGCHPRGHNLKNLFRKLKGKSAKKAKFLENAFTDIVNFYTIDTSRWVHFQSLDSYLKKYGGEDLFETYRYWALENKDLHHIPLFIHRELLVLLERMCQNWCTTVMSKRVNKILQNDFTRVTHRHANNCTRCVGDKKESESHRDKLYSLAKIPIELLKSRHDCKTTADIHECVNQIIPQAIKRVRQTQDPAVQYLINSLNDLPKGSVPQPCDIRLYVVWDDTKTKLSGVVGIQSGEKNLGRLTYRIDGRWFAEARTTSRTIFTRSKDDAVYWLANECTEVVQVSVDCGPYSPKRAISPVDFSRGYSGDGPLSPYRITLVDHMHGLSVGQHIKVWDGRPKFDTIAQGTISKVDGALVEFGD